MAPRKKKAPAKPPPITPDLRVYDPARDLEVCRHIEHVRFAGCDLPLLGDPTPFPWPPARWKAKRLHRTIIVAEHGGRVVGFLVFTRHPEPPAQRDRVRPDVDWRRPAYEIEHVAVLPEFQRRGIAGVLVGKLLKARARLAIDQVHAVVPETCLPALQFFRALGFRCRSVERGAFVRCDEPGLRMVWHEPGAARMACGPVRRLSRQRASAPNAKP